MIVLGIDPGSRRTGWGLVAQDGSRLRLLDVGLLRPAASQPLAERLALLHRELAELLERHAPDAVSLESVFHGPNTRSLVTLGQARGALMAAVGACGHALVELSPAEVKKAVTGRGSATKEQVAHMIGALLGVEAIERTRALGRTGQYDGTDALAVAVAAIHRSPRRAVLEG